MPPQHDLLCRHCYSPNTFLRGANCETMNETASNILTPEDSVALERIALQLQRPDIPDWTRAELLEAGSSIIEHYSCDLRICE